MAQNRRQSTSKSSSSLYLDEDQNTFTTPVFSKGRMNPPLLPPGPLPSRLDGTFRNATTSSNGMGAEPSLFPGYPEDSSRCYMPPNGYDALPPSVLSSSSQPRHENDPLVRFWSESGPWIPQGLQDGDMRHTVPRYKTNRELVPRPHASFSSFREPPRSDPGSYHTGRHLSDSGYGTKSYFLPSVPSAEYGDRSQGNPSLADDLGVMDLQMDDMPELRDDNSQDTALIGIKGSESIVQESAHPPSLVCENESCGIICKNQSELKKHRQRHAKPHTCDVHGCPRRGGFSTRNDLDRHKKSLHNIIPPNSADRSFRCRGSNCAKRDKIWPRLDNFRSHCTRMHKTEDIDELIKQSEVEPAKISDPDPDHDHDHLRPVRNGPPPPARHVTRTARADTQRPTKAPSNSPFLPQGSGWSGRVQSGQSAAYHSLDDHEKQGQGTQGTCDSSPIMYDQEGLGQQDQHLLQQARLQPGPIGSRPDHHGRNPAAGIVRSLESKAEELSRAIASDLGSDLGSMNLKQTTPHDLQSAIYAKVLSHLDLGLSTKRSSGDASLDEAGPPRAKRVICRSCSKTMERPCDLKKHEKRHSRPWGCTHSNCTKLFGSKNDWKRHENSQHYQLETWRCHEQDSTSKINECAKLFYRRDLFQAHLRKDHHLQEEEELRDRCRRGRIGRNGQSAFWCGFCRRIVKLESRGIEAWDERFNHIDDSHFKAGQSIDQWYPLDKDVPKGRLKNESRLEGEESTMHDESDSEESELEGNSGIEEKRSLRRRRDRPPPPPPPTPPPPAPPLPPPTHFFGSSIETGQEDPVPSAPSGDCAGSALAHIGAPKPVGRSRLRDNATEQPHAHKIWYCCKCSFGPLNSTDIQCWQDACWHKVCQGCRIEFAFDRNLPGLMGTR